jgi:hypothetical protein
MSEDFLQAYERARSQAGERAWNAMSQHDRADAIYRELRLLDAERNANRPPEKDPGADKE